MSDYVPVLARRVLLNRDPSLLQLSFDVAVVEGYRSRPEFSVIRTNSAGRVKKQGGWSIDFGIAEGEATIHASWQALANNLPDEELEHWAAHFVGGALSNNFLRMQLSPGSCFDDGEVRTW